MVNNWPRLFISVNHLREAFTGQEANSIKVLNSMFNTALWLVQFY